MASFFYLRGSKAEKRIYIFITKGTKFKIQRPTPFKINDAEWDQTNQVMKTPADLDGRKAEGKVLKNKIEKFNSDLRIYADKVNEYFDSLVAADNLTEKKMLDFLDGLKGKKKMSSDIPTDFQDFIDYYLECKPWLTESTIKVYRRTGNLIKRIFPKLSILDIDNNFKNEVAKFMAANNYQRSYLRKSLKNVKDFWRFAQGKGINVGIDPETWELEKEFPNVQDQIYTDPFLSLEELEAIKNTELVSDYLDNARDWLIISCWTAQRVSDLMGFSIDKISEYDGAKFISISQKKTGNKISIPLFKEVEKILDKRGGNFPRPISEQKYNEYIKKVCKKAGLSKMIHGAKRRQKTVINGRVAYRNEIGYFEKWELITSHVGRRSFISNFLRQIDAEKIKQVSGHKHTAMVEMYDKIEVVKKAQKLHEDFKNAGIE
ncbi:site-specific integrase [Chryseobacterium taklimakanense]|uniref:site-specific integrase n=1 Tax=Chryseobacterium taklimakanense TaxID=536441 RepID=UPI001EF6EE36|nr:site-specific integrase [Chryseobacterium taklimakanense]MCG7281758.1 site-specific integrase [Chryseobacterium taklimakanense]